MKNIDDILNYLTSIETDLMIVRPATEEDINLCNEDFTECGMEVSLPEGYAAFLRQLNGFAWNGIEFFSTDRVTDTETEYTLIDIVSANESFIECNEDFLNVSDYILLGRADDDLCVYNIKNEKYEVLDMSGRDVMEDFDTFETMFAEIVAPRIYNCVDSTERLADDDNEGYLLDEEVEYYTE